MTKEQQAQVKKLRLEGFGYKKIAEHLSLSRDTVRSFCVRNKVQVGANVPLEADVQTESNGTVQAESPSEFRIGNTVFVITTAYSETASETLEKKLEKLILNDAAREENCYLCA